MSKYLVGKFRIALIAAVLMTIFGTVMLFTSPIRTSEYRTSPDRGTLESFYGFPFVYKKVNENGRVGNDSVNPTLLVLDIAFVYFLSFTLLELFLPRVEPPQKESGSAPDSSSKINKAS